MWPFDKSKRVQKALIETEDGRIVPVELAVEKGYMVDHKTREAWGLFHESLIPKSGTKDMYVLLDERDAAPLVFDGKSISRKSLKDLISDIAKESRKQTQYEIQERQNRDRISKAMSLAVTCCAICVVITVVFSMIFSGGLF